MRSSKPESSPAGETQVAHMGDWKQCLMADPTDWLLEPENPPVRYRTLVDILDLTGDDPQVQAAKAAILSYPPVADLLAAQGEDGNWGNPDFYLPRASTGTFWVLTVLADLGLTAEVEHIRRACEFMFGHQRDDGQFCRRRRVPGQGWVWQEGGEPCTQARILRFLIQFGYGEDGRVLKGLNWLLESQREDGMWFCRGSQGHGCLRATLDMLRVAALDFQLASQPAIAQAAEVVRDLLMRPRMSRYHVGEDWGTWEKLKYPYFGFSVISALDALARLGYTPAEPKIANAVEYLISRQQADGSWPLDERWPRSPIDFGAPHEPNKWLTLDALRAVKLLYSQH